MFVSEYLEAAALKQEGHTHGDYDEEGSGQEGPGQKASGGQEGSREEDGRGFEAGGEEDWRGEEAGRQEEVRTSRLKSTGGFPLLR